MSSTEASFRDNSAKDSEMRSAFSRKRQLSPSVETDGELNTQFKFRRFSRVEITPIINPKKKPRPRVRQENRTHQPNRDADSIFNPRRTLSSNFKTLKEEMDSLQVVWILRQNGILDDDFYKKFCEKKTRKEKVMALLVQLDLLMVEGDYTQKIRVLQGFINALNESDQDELASQLKAPTSIEQHPYPTDEEVLAMVKLFHAKDKILETVEPRRFLDDVVTAHGIDLQEYNSIINKAEREDRVKELLNKMLPVSEKMLKIIKPMCDCYSDLYSHFRKSGSTKTALATGIGTQVAVRFDIHEKAGLQETTTEHSDPFTEIKKLQQSVVDSINNNPEEHERLQERVAQDVKLLLSRLSFSSVKLHLRTTSVTSLKDLKECCQNGKAIAWLKSLLKPEDIKILEEFEATDGQLECYIDDEDSEKQLFDEALKGCLCSLTKDTFKSNLLGFKDDLYGLESQVMTTLIKSKVLNEFQTKWLSDVETSGHNIKTQQDLINFLLQNEVPQLCFCMIEKLLAENKRNSTIQHLKGDLTDSQDEVQKKVKDVEMKRLREYTDLLEEELDARWFLSTLKAKSEEKFAKIVEVIETARSRKSRTKPFVRFLCEEVEDMEWFVKVLEECNPHLLAILSHQENLTQTSIFKNAMLSVCEFIIKEIEPLELKSHMTPACVKELQLDKIETISSERRERAIFFLIQLFRSKNDERIQDVMDAFASEYANIEKVIKDVSKSGSLCSYYRCPRLKKHQIQTSNFIFTGRFTLLEQEKNDGQPNMQPHKYQNMTLDIMPKRTRHISLEETITEMSKNETTEQTYDNAIPLQMEADTDAQFNAEKVKKEIKFEDKETKPLQKETVNKCKTDNLHSLSEITDRQPSEREVINGTDSTTDNGDKESLRQNCKEKTLLTQIQAETSPDEKNRYKNEPPNDKKEPERNSSQDACISSQESVESKPTDNLLTDTTIQDMNMQPKMEPNKYQNLMLDISLRETGHMSSEETITEISNNETIEQSNDNAVHLKIEADSNAQFNAEKVENENELEDKETKWLQKETSKKCKNYNMHSTSETTDTHQSQQEVFLNGTDSTIDSGDKESLHQNCKEKTLLTQLQEDSLPGEMDLYNNETPNDKKEPERNTSRDMCLSSKQIIGIKPSCSLKSATTLPEINMRHKTGFHTLITQPCKSDKMLKTGYPLCWTTEDAVAKQDKEMKQNVYNSGRSRPKVQYAKTSINCLQNNDKSRSVSGIASHSSQNKYDRVLTCSDRRKREERFDWQPQPARYHDEQKRDWIPNQMPYPYDKPPPTSQPYAFSECDSYYQYMQRQQLLEDHARYQRWLNIQNSYQQIVPQPNVNWRFRGMNQQIMDSLQWFGRRVPAVGPYGNACQGYGIMNQ